MAGVSCLSGFCLCLSHTGILVAVTPPRLYVGSGDLKFGLHSSSVSPAQYVFLIVLYFSESDV